MLVRSETVAIWRVSVAVSGMSIYEWIALGSMLAAWIAAWQAIRSTRLSRRMYCLSVAEQRRTEPALEVYLANSYIVHLQNEKRRIFVFHLLITNQSLAANSIKQVKLTLEYGQRGQPTSNVAVPHDSNAASAVGVGPLQLLRVPSPIAAGETGSGAAVFPISNALLGNSVVESYTVTVLDAYDRQAHCQAILLKEMES